MNFRLTSAGFVLLLITLLPTLSGITGAVAPAEAQSPAAKRLYQEAERLMQQGDTGAAKAELQLVVRQFPQDALAPKALLKLVDIHRAADSNHEARASLDKLLTDYPRTPEAASGFLVQAELKVSKARNLSDLEEARSIFRRVPLLYGAEEFPELEARSRARIRGGELAMLAGDTEAAEAEFVAVIEDEPQSSYTSRATLLLGRVLLLKNEIQHSMEMLQRLAESDTASDDDKAAARNLLSIAHRHILRPQSGQKHWHKAERFPASGLSLREPIGVAAADDGRVLVVDRKEGRTTLLDGQGNVLAGRGLKSPQRPGWAGDVPLVVTDAEIVLPFDNHEFP